VSPPDHLRA